MEALLVAGVPALVGPALLFLLCPLGNHHHTDIVPKVLHGVGGDDEHGYALILGHRKT